LVTGTVFTTKVPEDCPDGMLTLAGKVAAIFELERVTVAPPLGAGPFKVIVPVALLPPAKELGSTTKDDRASGTTVRLAVRVELLVDAVIVTFA